MSITGPFNIAVVSTDAAFREAIRVAAGGRIGYMLDKPYSSINMDDLAELEAHAPAATIIDLADDAEAGLDLAAYVGGRLPGCRIALAGPAPTPELLLRAMRAGIAEYVAKPTGEEELRGALARLRQGRDGDDAARTERPRGGVHLFVGAKGGAGATTVAVNTAIALAGMPGRRVLLLDLNLDFGDVALHLGLSPRFDVVDAVENLHRMDAGLLQSFLTVHETGVHVLASPADPRRAERVSPEALRRVLRLAITVYDDVVVDAPRALVYGVASIADEADRVHLVTTPELPALRNARQMVKLVEAGIEDDRLAVVMNCYAGGRSLPTDEAERVIGAPVGATLAADHRAASAAANAGAPLVLSRSRLARDVKGLAAEMAGSRRHKDSGRPRSPGALIRSLIRPAA